MNRFNLITILGATATGKTEIAARLAKEINGEVISADSRQVYKNMDIGTGKDLSDYIIDGVKIPYHLIDIVDAGYEYNVYEYQRDFIKVFNEITERETTPILCGGSGMYIEAVLKGYKLINVPVDESLRKSLENKSLEELANILRGYKTLHNKTDADTVKRAVRAIEIEEYYKDHPETDNSYPFINSLIIGIYFDRDTRRSRITKRLKDRLENGMIQEVQDLLSMGVKKETLIYYGLEYKYITQYLSGEIDYNTMFSQLETAIHQFSKRQMTWFRHMEKNGFKINWIEGSIQIEEKISIIKALFN
jgi:tRNA dimethylallyltransferase